jgi:hypothetical protein
MVDLTAERNFALFATKLLTEQKGARPRQDPTKFRRIAKMQPRIANIALAMCLGSFLGWHHPLFFKIHDNYFILFSMMFVAIPGDHCVDSCFSGLVQEMPLDGSLLECEASCIWAYEKSACARGILKPTWAYLPIAGPESAKRLAIPTKSPVQ